MRSVEIFAFENSPYVHKNPQPNRTAQMVIVSSSQCSRKESLRITLHGDESLIVKSESLDDVT